MRQSPFQGTVINDLAFEQAGRVFEEEDLLPDTIQMLLQQASPGRSGRVSVASQRCVLAHLDYRHAECAQALQEGDPFEIPPRETASSARISPDGREQADTLVIAQRVGGQPGGFGHLANTQIDFHASNVPS